MAQVFGNLKLLKSDMEAKGWVIDSFIFKYKNEQFVVLVKLFAEKEKKQNPYALVKLEFLRRIDVSSSLQVEASSSGLLVDAKTLRKFFNIEYSENLRDILQQFNENFSRFIPVEVMDNKGNDQLSVMVSSLSRSDSENPKKVYCFKVRRNGIKSNGELAQRSDYNDNKARILLPHLYSKFKDDKNISFCFSENEHDKKTDEEILANWAKTKND
ncbi:hypothetical protein KQJ23_07905 [Paenibacillus sp. MSJ-6]|uniref:Uncharacterized protein n=1 Tax=Paenibacillus brevis TaxID=2841508 RepID=A0ABS6FNF9_9BACL|nr:hypothetical protein [Paenibacillus brevis]